MFRLTSLTGISRREFLAGSAAGHLARSADAAQNAWIAITIDLEMARNYPTWDQTHWDYEKGNLDDAAKKYAVEAARRVKAKGGLIHFFVVGRVFEQEKVDWLEEIVQMGHPVGNHTYDHVIITATRVESLQPRFRRAPWLIAGNTPLQVIDQNIRMTTAAMKARLGVAPAGFRAPGGFPNGIADHSDVQRLLLAQGFQWASTKYVKHPTGVAGYVADYSRDRIPEPPREVFDGIVKAQEISQPSVYDSSLIEIPMCPISDLVAFRTGHWKLEYFLKAIRQVVENAIERRAAFVFLGHPSCLSVEDPEFRTVDLMCDLVRQAGNRARMVDLGTIARRVKRA